MSAEKIIKEDYKTKKHSFEYVLPDYEPTVKRVMLSDARLLENDRIVLSDTVTLSGTVEYRMVYQTVDDELASLCFSVPYEFTLAIDNDAERLVDSVSLSAFSCLPSGPRRVLAKGEVVATVQSFGSVSFPTLNDEDGVLTLGASFPYTSYLYSEDEEREYAETVCELVDPDAKVLFSDAVIRIDETRPMKDGALVGGKCLISTLLVENGGVRQLGSEIAFEEFLPMGTVIPENARIRCEGRVRSLSVEPQTQEGASVLVANALVGFSACASVENEVQLPLDAYSTSCELDAEMGEQVLEREVLGGVCRQTLSMKLSPEGADPAPMARLLYALPSFKITECTAKKDEIEMTVNLCVSLIGADANVEGETSVTDAAEEEQAHPRLGFVRQRESQSFTFTIPMIGACPSMECRSGSACLHGVCAFVEDGVFSINADLCVYVSLCEKTRVAVCLGVTGRKEYFTRREDCVLIVIPDAEDTLWSIAKENHASIEQILKNNPEIPKDGVFWNGRESLEGIKRIFIP